MTRIVLVVCAAALLPCSASAKRTAPVKVEPVTHEGVRYVVPNDDGRRTYIQAWDIKTNKKLWELTIFTNRIDPKLEEDVQWDFIEKLSVRDGTLIVTSEHGKAYQIDLKTKAVTQSDSTQSPAAEAASQLHEIPDAVERDIANSSLVQKYDLSFRVKPFYLRGDFNGDGKIDIAVLVKQRATGKMGIAIIDGATNNVTILGAGVSIGNGGDDFEWMDSWQVYAKERARHAAGETGVSRLRGDALLVSKSEAASTLIYWNGKRYVWLQQGD
jgi:hypothetical protein